MLKTLTAIVIALAITATGVRAEPTPASRLPVRSCGDIYNETAWRLDTNGYIGAYIQTEQPTTVTLCINAHGTAEEGIETPNLLVSIADQHRLFQATNTNNLYSADFDLQTGTYFVRIAFTNHATTTKGRVVIGSLQVEDVKVNVGAPDKVDIQDQNIDAKDVTFREDVVAGNDLIIHTMEVEGAKLLEEHTDALALAAADTYIEHGRRGRFVIHLPDATPGTQVNARLTRLAFNLGANIPGTSNIYITPDPEPGSMPDQFQKHFLKCFNATVPSNAGKWAYNEAQRDAVTMDYVDAILGYADTHNLWARMHTLIWNTEQQPDWVRELIDAALEDDAEAKAQLREEISERIEYYVRDRAKQIDAIDVLNESFHQPAYLDIFGTEGIADIYRETAEAIELAGADNQTFINEFNILQWSRKPPYDTDDTEPDPFANWYREHAEELQRHDARLGGIGVQYYADARTDTPNPHSPARIAQVLHNLSLTGLPVSLTEFGVARGAEPKRAATILSDTMRLMFGHPSGQTFLMFGFYRGATWERAAEGTLFDTDWTLSEPGKAYLNLLEQWSTDETRTVDDNHNIEFTGYYGEYEVTSGDRTWKINLNPSQQHYELRTSAGNSTAKTKPDEEQPMIRVALIFDDGPDPTNTDKLLTILKDKKAHVTFGQIAQNAQKHAALVARVIAEGHEIANHSLSHRHPSESDDAQMTLEVEEAQRVFIELGVRPVWYWPPYLAIDPRLDALTKANGLKRYEPVNLVDSKDYQRELSAEQIIERATTGVEDGSVILFHEWRDETVENLPHILDTLTERGCVFMTFSQLHESLNTTD